MPQTKGSPSVRDARDKRRLRSSKRLQFIEKHCVFCGSGPSRNVRATFWWRRLIWTRRVPCSPCRPLGPRPVRTLLTRPSLQPEQTRRDTDSRLGGGLLVTNIDGDTGAVPESHNSSECASAGPQATALCYPVLTLWPARHCPNNTPKGDSCPPPTAPQTPRRCTHAGGAPAPAAQMSLLSGYVLLRKTQKNPFSAVDDRLHFWSPTEGLMVETAYSKSANRREA